MRKYMLFIAISAIFISSAASAAPVLLRYKYTLGDQLMYQMNATGEGSVRMTPVAGKSKAKETPINMAMKMSMESVVTDTKPNGDATIETKIKRYSMTQNGNELLHYDESGKKQEKQSPLAEMMKSRFSMVITPRGEVKEIKGMDSFSKLNQQMDFSQIMSQLQQAFPEKPVEVGDKWKQSGSAVAGAKNAPMSGVDTEYEFVGFEQVKGLNCAKLNMVVKGDFSKMMKDMFADTLKTMGGKLEDLDVKTSGTLFFEPVAGILVAAEFTIGQRMVMTMKAPKSGGPDMKMVMKMNLEGVYELE